MKKSNSWEQMNVWQSSAEREWIGKTGMPQAPPVMKKSNFVLVGKQLTTFPHGREYCIFNEWVCFCIYKCTFIYNVNT